jgi:hypothetical protein
MSCARKLQLGAASDRANVLTFHRTITMTDFAGSAYKVTFTLDELLKSLVGPAIVALQQPGNTAAELTTVPYVSQNEITPEPDAVIEGLTEALDTNMLVLNQDGTSVLRLHDILA